MTSHQLPKARQQFVERPVGELQQLLAEHLDVLQSHCQQFDNGKKHFAAEIALNLRVLLLDNPGTENRALLHQLKLESTAFFDTSRTMTGGDTNISVSPVSGLAYQTIIPRDGILFSDWEPHLFVHTFGKPLSTTFQAWWEVPILHTSSGEEFSRRRIIRQMANSDRGGHVAPGIEKAYFELTRNANYTYESQIIQGDAVTNPNDPIAPERITPVSKEGSGLRLLRALARQIAHEVLMTLLRDTSIYLGSLSVPEQGISPIMFIECRHKDPTGTKPKTTGA